MTFKFVLFLVAAVGAASLQDIHQQSQQQQQQQNQQHHQEQQQQQQQHRYAAQARDQSNDEQIGYDFSYSVQDPVTGDIKNQEESRRNGNVRGRYSWVDADGNRQVVDYRADDRNGFTSEHRQEPAARPRPQQVWIRAPLYTINTVLAPVHTSSSRVDHHRRRQQDSRDDRDEHRADNRDNHENRDNRDEQRDGQDNRDERDGRDRDNQSSRDNQDNRDNRDNRNNRDNHEGSEQRNNRDDRDRSRDERRGHEGQHAQSEVRFQDPVVAYQYSS